MKLKPIETLSYDSFALRFRIDFVAIILCTNFPELKWRADCIRLLQLLGYTKLVKLEKKSMEFDLFIIWIESIWHYLIDQGGLPIFIWNLVVFSSFVEHAWFYFFSHLIRRENINLLRLLLLVTDNIICFVIVPDHICILSLMCISYFYSYSYSYAIISKNY